MSFPTTIQFASMSITDREAIDYSEAANLRTQVRSRGSHRWEFKGTFPPLSREESAEIAAFIRKTGLGQSFSIALPEYSDARGTASGTVRVNNGVGYPIGSTAIAIDGLTGTLLEGDFITFAGHAKAYMVVEDRSGAGTLTISPSLRTAVADNEVITYDGVEFTVRIPANKSSYSINNNSHVSISIDFIEAV